MNGTKVTKTRYAYRRPDNPANFITYAIAACVTFVGLCLSLLLSITHAVTNFPIYTVSVFIVLVVFVVCAIKFCLSPAGRIGGVFDKLVRCEKTVLTLAVFIPILLTGLQRYNATGTDNIFGYVLFAVIACAVVIDVAINLADISERKLIELALYVVIGFACVIRLDRIAVLCGDFCFWMCIGGFAVYLIGTVVGSISAIKCRRLLNSFAVIIGTALNFVGIFFIW